VLKGDVVDEVSKLRRTLDGEIVVYGSTRLVPTLVEHDLVDEVRLIVYPVVVGGGDRLFREMSDRRRLRLVQARAVGENLALLGYVRER
jgi:dihydrofolate reductase